MKKLYFSAICIVLLTAGSARSMSNTVFWQNLNAISLYHTSLHLINGASQAFLPTKWGIAAGALGSGYTNYQINKQLKRINKDQNDRFRSPKKFQYHSLFATLPLYVIGQAAGYTLKTIIRSKYKNYWA